jgi:hypothetical protein
MSTMEFLLKHPVEHRGNTISTLTGRRPKVRELRVFMKGVDRDSVGAMNNAIANLMEVDNAIIEELDLEDYGPIKKWFESFLKLIADDSMDT